MASYYWPTRFRDAHSYIRKCKILHKCARRGKKPGIPLQSVVIADPFEQWGLHIIGENNPNSSNTNTS